MEESLKQENRYLSQVKPYIKQFTELFKQIHGESILNMLKTPYLIPNITNTNTDLRNFFLTSMGSRWYTSDLHQSPVPFKHLSHCGTQVLLNRSKEMEITEHEIGTVGGLVYNYPGHCTVRSLKSSWQFEAWHYCAVEQICNCSVTNGLT